MNTADLLSLIRSRFKAVGTEPIDIEYHEYPEETIFIVKVNVLTPALVELGNKIDRELANLDVRGLVAVRGPDQAYSSRVQLSPAKRGVGDRRIGPLLDLITSRARTSEAQPSLEYIPDTERAISRVLTPRHHLIFGRRGAGKTALMVETKRRVEERGALTLWMNLQVYRRETIYSVFAWICRRLCELMLKICSDRREHGSIAQGVASLSSRVEQALASSASPDFANSMIPQVHYFLQQLLSTGQAELFLFLDELHYIGPRDQPLLLDMIHALVRDSRAWLKIAGIKHLCRWFQPQPPVGLQSGHDADHIDLDVTLESPARAKSFLERVLQSYVEYVGISYLTGIFSAASLDRLVLASGAVPRDYLTLAAEAVRQAEGRVGKIVGVQDVNKAAGVLARSKILELEEDAASSEEGTSSVLNALQVLRSFCLDEKSSTYFRIDFRDKEARQSQYSLIQDLMDLRLLHLLESSLSDEHQAGRRSEVYMLDLSQFSGQRLRRRLKVLDFSRGAMVLKETGTKKVARVGDTPKLRLGLLRRAPVLELQDLMRIAEQGPDPQSTASTP